MRVIVTGGAGFIGTNLISRLLRDNHRVVSLDNYITGKRENEVKNLWYRGCIYYDVDITETADYSFFMDKPDVIFHLAALARIQPSIKDPVPAIENNFNGTLNILEYARNNNIRVVYAGSSSFHHGLYGSPYAWSNLAERIDYVLSNFNFLNEKINHNIRERFNNEYRYEKLCMYWYNIFSNLDSIVKENIS